MNLNHNYRKLVVVLTWALFVSSAHAQTVWIPDGTSGIADNTTNANVGIGTSSPRAKLHVLGHGGVQTVLNSSLPIDSGSVAAKYGFGLSGLSNSSANTLIGIHVDDVDQGGLNYAAVGVATSKIRASGMAVGVLASDVQNDHPLAYGDAIGILIDTIGSSSSSSSSTAEGIRITNSISNGATPANRYAINSQSTAKSFFAGDIGLGTSSPQAKLDVVSQGDGAVVLKLNTERPWQFEQSGTGNAAQLNFRSLAGGKWFNIQAYDGTNIAGFEASAGGGNILLAPVGGSVGIGVSSPSEKLEVNGTVRAKEVVVESTGWPDYVFDETYALPSLSEVESHVREHKHLPDVPSAAEVAQSGISLGEMQTILLRKVEELTLHLIEQNRAISSQQATTETLVRENNELRDRIAQIESRQ